jgi:enoyl-CoA hydratase/carnithine racemase
MSTYQTILVDAPATSVARITLNRPEKRNAISTPMRTELLEALRAHDHDPDIRVTVVRGAGSCFSAGYDLGAGPMMEGSPFYSAPGDGQWARQANDTWFSVWDLAKPVIAQVHGYCLAGGSELATGCDLVVVADDAQIGYPAVRFGVPDMHFHAWFMGMRTAMDMMLTGDSISGTEAVRLGWANYAYPAEDLDDKVLAYADRIAMMPTDLVQLNKRLVHRTMETMGLRTAIRLGTEICALGIHQPTMRQFVSEISSGGLTGALSKRDEPYGDYRTSETED